MNDDVPCRVTADLNRYLITQEDDYVDPIEAEIQYQEYLADQDEGGIRE